MRLQLEKHDHDRPNCYNSLLKRPKISWEHLIWSANFAASTASARRVSCWCNCKHIVSVSEMDACNFSNVLSVLKDFCRDEEHPTLNRRLLSLSGVSTLSKPPLPALSNGDAQCQYKYIKPTSRATFVSPYVIDCLNDDTIGQLKNSINSLVYHQQNSTRENECGHLNILNIFHSCYTFTRVAIADLAKHAGFWGVWQMLWSELKWKIKITLNIQTITTYQIQISGQ